MRSLKHISGRYIIDRLSLMAYERANPDRPWLTHDANKIFESWLKKTDHMLEFGSSRSTLWFAEHVGQLTSIEHNKEWFNKVKELLHDRQLTNVDYLYHQAAEDEAGSFDEPYVAVADQFADASLDAVLVDGACRGH